MCLRNKLTKDDQLQELALNFQPKEFKHKLFSLRHVNRFISKGEEGVI